MKKRSAFITGGSGQDWAYLAQLLVGKGYEVYGGLRRNSHDELYRLRLLGVQDKVKLLNFEITDQFGVTELISKYRFDEVWRPRVSSGQAGTSVFRQRTSTRWGFFTSSRR